MAASYGPSLSELFQHQQRCIQRHIFGRSSGASILSLAFYRRRASTESLFFLLNYILFVIRKEKYGTVRKETISGRNRSVTWNILEGTVVPTMIPVPAVREHCTGDHKKTLGTRRFFLFFFTDLNHPARDIFTCPTYWTAWSERDRGLDTVHCERLRQPIVSKDGAKTVVGEGCLCVRLRLLTVLGEPGLFTGPCCKRTFVPRLAHKINDRF